MADETAAGAILALLDNNPDARLHFSIEPNGNLRLRYVDRQKWVEQMVTTRMLRDSATGADDMLRNVLDGMKQRLDVLQPEGGAGEQEATK